MSEKIYGVDINSNFSAEDVRDAMIVCFSQAHEDVLSQTFESGVLSAEEIKNLKQINVVLMVKQMFEKIGGDYFKPTKESLIEVAGSLKEFARNFRSDAVVEKHYTEIMRLVEKLK